MAAKKKQKKSPAKSKASKPAVRKAAPNKSAAKRSAPKKSVPKARRAATAQPTSDIVYSDVRRTMTSQLLGRLLGS